MRGIDDHVAIIGVVLDCGNDGAFTLRVVRGRGAVQPMLILGVVPELNVGGLPCAGVECVAGNLNVGIVGGRFAPVAVDGYADICKGIVGEGHRTGGTVVAAGVVAALEVLEGAVRNRDIRLVDIQSRTRAVAFEGAAVKGEVVAISGAENGGAVGGDKIQPFKSDMLAVHIAGFGAAHRERSRHTLRRLDGHVRPGDGEHVVVAGLDYLHNHFVARGGFVGGVDSRFKAYILFFANFGYPVGQHAAGFHFLTAHCDSLSGPVLQDNAVWHALERLSFPQLLNGDSTAGLGVSHSQSRGGIIGGLAFALHRTFARDRKVVFAYCNGSIILRNNDEAVIGRGDGRVFHDTAVYGQGAAGRYVGRQVSAARWCVAVAGYNGVTRWLVAHAQGRVSQSDICTYAVFVIKPYGVASDGVAAGTIIVAALDGGAFHSKSDRAVDLHAASGGVGCCPLSR